MPDLFIAILFFPRQLLKDYQTFCYAGFLQSMLIVPTVLVKKEDALGQDVMAGDLTDPEVAEEMMRKATEKQKVAFRNEPQIKVVIAGNFLDMIERGIFKV